MNLVSLNLVQFEEKNNNKKKYGTIIYIFLDFLAKYKGVFFPITQGWLSKHDGVEVEVYIGQSTEIKKQNKLLLSQIT